MFVMRIKFWALIFILAASVLPAHADATFLLEEPYGTFGGLNPTGHGAVYLNRVCAESPTRLRRCEPGETGVVISRYHKIAGYDWIAIPLVPYLYAVDSIQEIPKSADAQTVAELRDRYRREHLQALAPNRADGSAPGGEWVQLVGEAYDRRIYGYTVSTTEAQDDALISRLNSRGNKSHFNLFFHNCADFSKSILNFYYPHSVHRNLFADVGITTPKQVAKCLVSYGRKHETALDSTFIIPQVPGLPHSEHVDGVLEALLKSKKYVVPLAVLHPVLTATLAVAYIGEGRFNPRRNAQFFDVARLVQAEPGSEAHSSVNAVRTTSVAGGS